jgi:hypothetical protein
MSVCPWAARDEVVDGRHDVASDDLDDHVTRSPRRCPTRSRGIDHGTLTFAIRRARLLLASHFRAHGRRWPRAPVADVAHAASWPPSAQEAVIARILPHLQGLVN